MSRKVKFKFVSIPIRYELGLSLEGVTKWKYLIQQLE